MSGHTPSGLLPCPFCGKPPYSFFMGKVNEISCDNADCDAGADVTEDTEEYAVHVWNSRPHAANEAKIEALTNALREIKLMSLAYVDGRDATGWCDRIYEEADRALTSAGEK